MNGIIIAAIICVTLVVLGRSGVQEKDRLIKGQAVLLEKYKAMVDALLAAVRDGELGAQEVPPPEIDGGE